MPYGTWLADKYRTMLSNCRAGVSSRHVFKPPASPEDAQEQRICGEELRNGVTNL